ncbi:galactose oxidase-like domain-containing protein [Actinoplanes sp. RD1]|uniref:galactose oxidase-like domain-containing protein n=1 Tax=Actinoplanes sp. RD1 TaxID=3064538 RepID=UPI0027429BEF|nr:galactose oxidase-like domain-containing protein [Actinoplanes sp. RD1]
MATKFLEIPEWQSFENQGAGSAVADVSGNGRPDLIVLRVDAGPQRNQGFYRVGFDLDADGEVTGGWGPWVAVPDWFAWENQGADIAVARLDGALALIVLQVDAPAGQNRGVYRVGRVLDAAGQVTGGWTEWLDVPEWFPWQNADAGLAVADLDGDDRPELIVFMVDAPAGANAGYYRIGHALGADGRVHGGWDAWRAVPDWFMWENQGAGIAVADLDGDGRPELLVLAVDNPAGANLAFYQIGWRLGGDGHAEQGWSAWTAVPEWFFWENQGAGVALHQGLVIVAADAPMGPNLGFYRTVDLQLDTGTAARDGVWRLAAETSQSLAIHAAALHTGEILFFSGTSNNPANLGTPFRGTRWNPVTHEVVDAHVPADFFCAGHAQLPDGGLLVAGGTEAYDPFRGLRDAWVYDASANAWDRQPDMAGGRWYPTLVTLADGHVAAFSGLGQDSLLNLVPEIWSGAWEQLPDQRQWDADPHDSTRRVPLYAQMYLLADGRIFFSGGCYGGNENLGPALLDLAARTFTQVPGLDGHAERDHRNQATSVLLPPAQDQEVLLIGGGEDFGHHGRHAIAAVNRVDLKAAHPAYHHEDPMERPRMHHVAVVLPDRTVLVTGGSEGDEDRPLATTRAEIYHPSTGTWTLHAHARVIRLYHSVALLLADGSVVTAGSNPNRGDEEYRIERYYPPYLFRGPRPALLSAPEHVHHGETITVECPSAGEIEFVNLTRAGSTTHCLNTDQRLVDVPIIGRGTGRLTVTVPESPNLLPPGWYMLTVVAGGVPSEARWVQVESH